MRRSRSGPANTSRALVIAAWFFAVYSAALVAGSGDWTSFDGGDDGGVRLSVSAPAVAAADFGSAAAAHAGASGLEISITDATALPSDVLLEVGRVSALGQLVSS